MVRYTKKKLLEKAKTHRIKINELVEEFGEKKAFLIIKVVFNNNAPEYLKDNLFKSMFKNDKNSEKWKLFLEELKYYGIKTKTFNEPLWDEDSGEIVEIPRTTFKIWGDSKNQT